MFKNASKLHPFMPIYKIARPKEDGVVLAQVFPHYRGKFRHELLEGTIIGKPEYLPGAKVSDISLRGLEEALSLYANGEALFSDLKRHVTKPF